MIRRWFGFVVFAVIVGAVVKVSLPDITRYLKIRQMLIPAPPRPAGREPGGPQDA